MMKRFLPKTLFARALLIVVLPTVLVQLVSAYIFFDRHWGNVAKHMGNALGGEIAFLAYQASTLKQHDREALSWVFENTTGIVSSFEPGQTLPPETLADREDFIELRQALRGRLDFPFSVRRLSEEEQVEIRVQQSDGVLVLRTSLKRLESGTTLIFMFWMIGSSLVFLCIATVFLRNQVRPIRDLAEAAESFGKGRDHPNFKPHGALEVRRAARAFLVMRDRIQRQIRSRTEMLAGISHDLRTPLTRMKLQLAMLGGTQEIQELQSDVTQMERMITEYLDFARGDGGEEAAGVSLNALLQSVADDYLRLGKPVPLTLPQDITLRVREGAFRRMLHNVIDNALRYGGECAVTAQALGGRLELWVDDKGPGIPEAQREEVFRPFTRLEGSRNVSTGGVGLGLAIARDIVRAHGGDILLASAPGGGLRVVIRLPL